MNCYVYRSPRKAETYLFLAEKDDFSVIPQALRQVFGEPEFSFEFELSAEKQLIQEDPREVQRNLEDRGFHLQMPSLNQMPI